MGFATRMLKAGLRTAVNQVKGVDVVGGFKTGLSQIGVDVPHVEMPDAIKNFKPNWGVKDLKIPYGGISTQTSPIASSLLSGIQLPSEINGVKLPEVPDFTSVGSDVEKYFSKFGLSTDKLGIRNVDDILTEPDLSSLKGVKFSQPVDLDNMPDLSTSLDEFDIGGLQGQIDGITSKVDGMEKIDLKKYF